MISDFFLSQVLATLAFACGIISFQFKNRRTILLGLFGSAIANSCHFVALGRPGPSVLALIIGVRFLSSALSTDRRLMYLFTGITLVGFFLSNKDSLSYLGLIATLLATYAGFQENDRRIRVIFVLAGTIWVVGNALSLSPVATFMEATFVMSNMIGYWRFYYCRRSIDGADNRGMVRTDKSGAQADIRVGTE